MNRGAAFVLVVALAGCPGPKASPPPPVVARPAPVRLTAAALARARAIFDEKRKALRITIGESGDLGVSSDHERPGDTAWVDSGVPVLVPAPVADAFQGIVIDWTTDASGLVGFRFDGTALALDHEAARELRKRLPASSMSRVAAPRPGLGPGEAPNGPR